MTSNRLDAALRSVVGRLRELGARFALIGGMAVSLRAEERSTRDIDLALAVHDDREAERIVLGLQSHGYQPSEVLEQRTTGRLATVRLAPPSPSRVIIDLLFASSGIEQEIVNRAEEIELSAGLTLPVATTAQLLALKVLSEDETARLQDRIDLFSILKLADPSEILNAFELLQLIMSRGTNRGQDLERKFHAIIEAVRKTGVPISLPLSAKRND